jgi:hypothetical protein
MSCGAIDIGCHVAAYFDPLLTWWGAAGAFIRSWWWVAYGAVMLLIGAHLGPARAYGIVTAGVVAIVLRYWPQRADDPEYETGEPEPPPKPKKPKGIFGDLVARKK